MLVTCNCKVLKLYAQPRGTKRRRSNYTNLKEGEGGRYGIISVTNPNYESFNQASPSMDTSDLENQNFIKMSYKEDNFVERSDSALYTNSDKLCGELAGALDLNDIVKGPPPASV